MDPTTIILIAAGVVLVGFLVIYELKIKKKKK